MRPEVHHQMGGVNVEDGRRGLMHRYPKCTFLKQCNFNFIGRYVSRAKKNTTWFDMQSICLSSLYLRDNPLIHHMFVPCKRIQDSLRVCSFEMIRISDPWSLASHGRLTEPMNPCPKWIGQLNWFTMIRVISDHWFCCGSSQTNAPLEILDSAVDSGF